MLLEQDHFDEWMQRLMRRLEELERACTARRDELPVAAPGERLLDNGDLCRMLNVSKRSLQRYRTLGDLPYQMLYHKTYYKEADVLRFIETKFSQFRTRKETRKIRIDSG